MKQPILLRVVWVTAMSLAMAWNPPAFAQRGGHAGGAGFHGAGGHFVSGGSRVYAGHSNVFGYGGAYHAVRGGYHHGWHGGYWGYPRYGYGYGWGFSVGFGWPYCPTYVYPYGYGWGVPSPYYYPYYPYYPPPYAVHPNRRREDHNGSEGAPPPNPAPKSEDNIAPGDPDGPARESLPRNNYANAPDIQLTALRMAGRTTGPMATSRRAQSLALEPLRPEVERAIRALREMPPYARQREIDHGRYRNFSAEEKELLRSLDTRGFPRELLISDAKPHLQ